MKKKYYLFQRKYTKVTHGVETRFNSMGSYGLDRIFGGGMLMLCGQECSGKGVLSACPMSDKWITCKKCLKVLAKIKAKQKPEPVEVWPPETVVPMDVPRTLCGIPG